MGAVPTRHRCSGGIVIRTNKKSVEFLLLKQIRNTGEIQWVMPKGHIRKGETSEASAIREVREEVGLEELRLIACIGMQEFRYCDGNGIKHEKAVDWYLMETPYESHLTLNIEEGFVDSKWLRSEEARKQCSHEDFRPWVDRAAETLGIENHP
ncbi:MAG: NUDIX domain-containing protein [Candidatus Poribacteria bacterium]|nr:NUDIX domain-containing protein [Candidatus Poribacteria bacterium]MDE0504028.1 NUDIX domain-containing protein [Candidatus Poribacteria bacterium]